MTRPEPFRLLFLRRRNTNGFSYLEILITLMILSIFFLPAMDMFSKSVAHLAYIGEMNTALSLAREGMERARNLRMSEAQLAERGEVFEPLREDPPIELNGNRWRILQQPGIGTDPLVMNILVYKDELFNTPIINISTLIEDVE